MRSASPCDLNYPIPNRLLWRKIFFCCKSHLTIADSPNPSWYDAKYLFWNVPRREARSRNLFWHLTESTNRRLDSSCAEIHITGPVEVEPGQRVPSLSKAASNTFGSFPLCSSLCSHMSPLYSLLPMCIVLSSTYRYSRTSRN